jgi:hypothetical protein
MEQMVLRSVGFIWKNCTIAQVNFQGNRFQLKDTNVLLALTNHSKIEATVRLPMQPVDQRYVGGHADKLNAFTSPFSTNQVVEQGAKR